MISMPGPALPAKGSEMITGSMCPVRSSADFMDAVRADAKQHAVDIIYGTIRIIERDDETVLAWARERWACIRFSNLHVEHTADGIEKAAGDFRCLIH